MQLTTHEWCDCITKYCKDFEHPAALPKIWSAYGTAISRENIKNILPFPFALPLSHFIYPNDRATENFSKNFGKFFFQELVPTYTYSGYQETTVRCGEVFDHNLHPLLWCIFLGKPLEAFGILYPRKVYAREKLYLLARISPSFFFTDLIYQTFQ